METRETKKQKSTRGTATQPKAKQNQCNQRVLSHSLKPHQVQQKFQPQTKYSVPHHSSHSFLREAHNSLAYILCWWVARLSWRKRGVVDCWEGAPDPRNPRTGTWRNSRWGIPSGMTAEIQKGQTSQRQGEDHIRLKPLLKQSKPTDNSRP